MNPVIDLDNLKQVVEGIGDQISTTINIEKLRKLIPNTNLLDNWYLKDPINQRNETFYGGGGYGIDRWKCGDIEVNPNVVLQHKSSSMYQPLESELKEFLDGKVVTASVLTENDCYYGTMVYQKAPEGAQYFCQENVHLAIDKNGDFVIYNSYDGPSSLIAVKLQIGNKQTLAYQNTDGVWSLNDYYDDQRELIKCLRYQIVFVSTSTESAKLGTAISFPGNTGECVVSTVPMRARPVVTTYGTHIVCSNGTNAYAVSQIYIASSRDTNSGINVGIKLDTASNVPAGVGFGLTVRSGGKITLDANL